MQSNQVSPQHAPERMKLFRFWDARNAYFKNNLERLIGHNELYLSSRANFNDPFDLRPILKCDWTASGIRRYARKIWSDPSKSASPLNAARFSLGAGGPKYSLQAIRDLKKKFPLHMDELFNKLGICCFTEEMQNPIFWAHYAGSYTGVCGEFAATGDSAHTFSNVMKVHYTSERPTIYATHTGALGTASKEDWTYIAQFGVCTKSNDWSVEREWRWWLHGSAEKFQSIPRRALKKIFLGPKASNDTKQFVVDLGKTNSSSVAVFETKLSNKDFRVEQGRRLL